MYLDINIFLVLVNTEGLVGEKIGCKVRSVELNILQRCAGYMLSETDIMEQEILEHLQLSVRFAERVEKCLQCEEFQMIHIR